MRHLHHSFDSFENTNKRYTFIGLSAGVIGTGALLGAGAYGLSQMGGGNNQNSINDAAGGLRGVSQQLIDETEMTPEELAQYNASFGLGQNLSQTQQYLAGIGQAPAGYQGSEQQYVNQGPLAQATYGQTLYGAQNPYANYQSSLAPSLQLAQNSIDQAAQGRGMLQSGVPIEQLGMAGATLAVQNAQGMMQAYQQSMSNASTLQGQISGQSNQNMSNLQNLYNSQQNSGLTAMNRQAQGATAAAGYQSAPYYAQMGAAYGNQAAQNALPGQLIGAAGTLGAGYMSGNALSGLTSAITNATQNPAISNNSYATNPSGTNYQNATSASAWYNQQPKTYTGQ